MPGSASDFDLKVIWFTRYLLPTTTFLDVGAGSGKWADLLRPYFPAFDGIEIWEPYIEQYKLREKYRTIYHGLAQKLVLDLPPYDVIILGAVLEHFSAKDGVRFLDICLHKIKRAIIVIVPYKTPQGAVNGNIYERHLQYDLTPEIMASRYPALMPLQTNENRGLYIGHAKQRSNKS